MRSRATICCLFALLTVVAGCRTNKRGELVEAELRTKERLLRETSEELERSRLVNEALEREFLRRSRDLPPGTGNPLLSPKDIIIGRGTGGVDDDGIPGDEALQVVVVPRDEDGNPVRVLGILTVVAWEIMPGGTKVPLSSWELGAEELRRTWKSGLLGSGYHVVLKWKKLPTQEKLRIAVQLKLPDERTYEADKDISIRPLKQIERIPPPLPMDKMPSAPQPEPGPIIPEAAARILPPQRSSFPNDD